MQAVYSESAGIDLLQSPSTGTICIGRIVEMTDDGQALVDFFDNPEGPVKARSVLQTPLAEGERPEGLAVLLAFEDGDLSLPIILGIIRTSLFSSTRDSKALLTVPKPRFVTADGKKVLLDAKEEIVLRCGQSSITLRKDGKIVIKGTELTSRASRTNKIKGGAVKIN
ncbi:MAG: DUF2345 domain-containing protein [Gemmataceae bacterium]|nr:DUF2345 domain-containing protein [Gemmataceae bacterium]MCI0738264.1 DUF2345 domain-containing protein [Gemmataceae bacterium]